MSRGLYIVLEGPDGAGKGEQAKPLARRLQELGIEVFPAIEPGGPDEMGQTLRHLVKEVDGEPLTKALLFTANRVHNLPYIKNDLEKGWVVADRNYLSTLAYQGYGNGLDVAMLEQLTETALGGFKPDLTILLDLPFEVAQQRINSRGTTDKIEGQGDQYLRRVHEGYRQLARTKHADVVVNADQTVEQIAQDIWSHVEPLLLGR